MRTTVRLSFKLACDFLKVTLSLSEISGTDIFFGNKLHELVYASDVLLSE